MPAGTSLGTYIKADLHRIYPGPFTLLKLMKGFRSKGFKYLFFLRIAGHSRQRLAVWMARVMLYILTYRYGFQISRKAVIGPGLYIGHFGTVVISQRARVGDNCNIGHNVTIGAARGAREGAPTIGCEVWIGTGAVLTGSIKVGSRVLIAPNAFVNFDVPNDSLVLGNPGKIIPKKDPVRNYINNCWTVRNEPSNGAI